MPKRQQTGEKAEWANVEEEGKESGFQILVNCSKKAYLELIQVVSFLFGQIKTKSKNKQTKTHLWSTITDFSGKNYDQNLFILILKSRT